MLILTRRVGETLMIGDDITVTVLGVKGNQVRVGVSAPRELPVHREEVYERVHGGGHPRQMRPKAVVNGAATHGFLVCAHTGSPPTVGRGLAVTKRVHRRG